MEEKKENTGGNNSLRQPDQSGVHFHRTCKVSCTRLADSVMPEAGITTHHQFKKEK
jgi:hypothetical protein